MTPEIVTLVGAGLPGEALLPPLPPPPHAASKMALAIDTKGSALPQTPLPDVLSSRSRLAGRPHFMTP
jgi:hypothetical protein